MLLVAAQLLLPVAIAVSPIDAEYQATRHVVSEFLLEERPAPAGDPILTRVARRLSAEALRGTSSSAADLLSISRALSAEGGWDPPPRALIVQGSPAALALQSLLTRRGFADEPATHLGVGAASVGERTAMTVLLAERRAVLDPVPNRLPRPGTNAPVCGELLQPYVEPRVYVTAPSGEVSELEPKRKDGARFCANLAFNQAGEYAVELVAEGTRGPEVAALFFVTVGEGGPRPKSAWFKEPGTRQEARVALTERVNHLRAAHGLVELGLDDTLSRVAQAYADQLARDGALVHQTEQGRGIAQRLRAANYDFAGVAENLATASGPLAAHFALEQSPGHRQNLLDPRFDRVGIGVSWRKGEEGARVIIAELLVATPREARVNVNSGRLPGPTQLGFTVPEGPPDEDPLVALNRDVAAARAKKGVPPAKRSEALDAIAAGHVDDARAGTAALSTYDHVFAAETGAGQVSLHVVTPADARKLAALLAPDTRSIGLAAVPGTRRGTVDRFVVVVAR